ncbi:MAG: carbohydrate binding domain-containing protein [Verrucomicrobiota bacterium]
MIVIFGDSLSKVLLLVSVLCLANLGYGADNLIPNPNFKSGKNHWHLQTHGESVADISVLSDPTEGGSLKLGVELAEERDWSIQLINRDVQVKGGIVYRLTFSARANQGTWISINLREVNEGKHSYIAKSDGTTISTGWNDYEVEFSKTTHSASAQLIFQHLNKSGLEVEFKDFSLQKKSDSPKSSSDGYSLLLPYLNGAVTYILSALVARG